MKTNLQARLIDLHTVVLGNDERWMRLSLPWLARDLAQLLTIIRTDSVGDPADAQRLTALRLVLARLEDETAENESPTSTLCPQTHFRQATLIGQDETLPEIGPVVWRCHPSALLDLEAALAGRDPNAATALLVVSAQAVIASPVLPTQRFCPLCFRYLAAPVFGLQADESVEEQAMTAVGLALARTVERQSSDALIYDRRGLEIEPFVPFIGCPQCLVLQ